jgi:hypothetical protein
LRQQQSLQKSGVIAQRDVDVAQTAYQTAKRNTIRASRNLISAVEPAVVGRRRCRPITSTESSSHRRKWAQSQAPVCRGRSAKCSRLPPAFASWHK